MLETIREYAAERLDESPRAGDLRGRHAMRMLALAEETEPKQHVASQDWLDLLEREQDNVRAALDYFDGADESEHAARLAGAVWRFWCQSNRHPEGERRLERAVANYRDRTVVRALALVGAADMAGNAGDYERLRRRAGEARTIYQDVGDNRGVATANLFLGGGADRDRRQLKESRDLFRESVRLFHEVGDELAELEARSVLGRALTELGELDEAQALISETLERARALGDPVLLYPPLMGSAGIAIEQGRAEDALASLKECVLITLDSGQLLRVRMALGGVARALSMRGDPEPAARLLACTEALGREITGNFAWVSARRKGETLASLREQLGEEALAKAWERGSVMTLDEGVELALSVG